MPDKWLGVPGTIKFLRYLEGKPTDTHDARIQVSEIGNEGEKQLDFSDVRGQNELIGVVTLAAAGGHNMLMIGEPGCGKTMIAQRIPTILPQMTEEECLEVTKFYSISGLLPNGHSLMKARPFRAPHHNAFQGKWYPYISFEFYVCCCDEPVSLWILSGTDIQKSVHPVDFFGIDEKKPAMSSEQIRKRVEENMVTVPV